MVNLAFKTWLIAMNNEVLKKRKASDSFTIENIDVCSK